MRNLCLSYKSESIRWARY